MALDRLHLEDLRKSGLSAETIAQAGLYSVPPRDVGKITAIKGVISLLAIPYDEGFTRYKVFPPTIKNPNKKGTIRYLQPGDSGVHLYIPPILPAGILHDPSLPLDVIEGEKKGLKSCQEGIPAIALGGVYNWLKDGRLIPDFEPIALDGRTVVYTPDSDAWRRVDLLVAVYRFGAAMQAQGARFLVRKLLDGPGKTKMGGDDFLVAYDVDTYRGLHVYPLTDPIFAKARAEAEKTAETPQERLFPTLASISYTARELQREQIPALKTVIDDLFVEGLTLIAGTASIGKSVLLLQLAIAGTTGGKFLGQWVTVNTDVLYLGTEDNKRRMEFRLSRLWEDDTEWPDNLTVAHRPQTLDAGLIEQLEEWRSSHPDARLIIIDLWGDVKPQRRQHEDWYTADRAAGKLLADYANLHHLTIIASHHTNRLKLDDPFESFHGGNGLLGVADTKMILLRQDDTDTTWHIKGRDVPKQAYTLELVEGIWIYKGESTGPSASPAMHDLLKYLALNPDVLHSPADVARSLGKSRGVVKALLSRAFHRGLVGKVGSGLYKYK